MNKYLPIFSSLLLLSVFSSVSAIASDSGRHIAGKLTTTVKPAVRVLSDDELSALMANRMSMDLSVDPAQVICRTERVSSTSRLMTRRCKTVAEFRMQDEKANNQYQNMVDEARRRQAIRVRGNVRRDRRVLINGT